MPKTLTITVQLADTDRWIPNADTRAALIVDAVRYEMGAGDRLTYSTDGGRDRVRAMAAFIVANADEYFERSPAHRRCLIACGVKLSQLVLDEHER